MMVFMVYNFGTCGQLVEARKPTADEATRFSASAREQMLYGAGNSVDIPHVGITSVPRDWWKERKIYMFPGCDNQAVEITAAEWDMLAALNAQREAEKTEKERKAEIEELEGIVSRAERQQEIPTPEKAHRMLVAWNNVENEGGEGFVPDVVDVRRYEWAKKRLMELKNGSHD